MTFLISDVHGMSRLFFSLLSQVSFGETDTLYILGDVAAKGPEALPVYEFAMNRDNVHLLRGNHDERLLQYFGGMGKDAPKIPDDVMHTWAEGDGVPTIREFNSLCETKKRQILRFLLDTPLFQQISEKDQEYLLLHGAPARDGGYHGYDVLENRYESPEAPKRIKGPQTVIVGHTPTYKYGEQYAGKILLRPDKIFLDCGAGSGYGMGILNLSLMQACYVRNQRDRDAEDTISKCFKKFIEF